MPTDSWAAFRRQVLAEPALQERLLAGAGRAEFVATAVRLAGDLGLSVREEDVDEAVAEARTWWWSRWI